MTAYWSDEWGRYGTGESYDWFPKYEDGVETFDSGDGLWTCTDLEDGVEILRYNGDEINITVPAEVNGKKVVSLESTFDGFTALKSAAVPQGVTSMEAAFYGCESLEQVSLPESAAMLCYAFNCCFQLKQIDLPEAFADCEKLRSVVMEDGITGIGDYAFFNCTSLKELTIPESVTEFGKKAVGMMEIREYTSPDKSAFRIKGYQVIPGFKIRGKAGSKAEEYARKTGIEFVQI